MKRAILTRTIVSLMVMMAIVYSTTIATASIPNGFGSGLGSGGWLVTAGGIDSGGIGVVQDAASAQTAVESRAAHEVTTNSNGAFNADFTFKVVNLSSEVYVGVASGPNGDDIQVGWNANSKQFIVVKNSDTALATLSENLANPTATYTAHISSTDGKTLHCTIDGVGSYDYSSGFAPKYVVIRIHNNGLGNGNPHVTNGPQVGAPTFSTPAATATVSPTVSPSPSPGTNATALDPVVPDYSDIQNWYATQYTPVQLSNQSLVYDQGGNIVKVVTGKPGEATTMPISEATVAPTIAPTATPAANVTTPTKVTTNNTPTIPPVATAAPTRSQSPGFGIVLAAIGMLAAIVLVSRKK
jgi:PGF-CTERM protein